MKANVGDRLVLEGTHVGDVRRVGVVVAVRHDDGRPPYMVRWLDNEHESLFFPGPDARVEPSQVEPSPLRGPRVEDAD